MTEQTRTIAGDEASFATLGDEHAPWQTGVASPLGQAAPASAAGEGDAATPSAPDGTGRGRSGGEAGQLVLDVSWVGLDAAADGTVDLEIEGIRVARLTMPGDGGSVLAITYLNGASGTLSELLAARHAQIAWVIDLPASIPSAGALTVRASTSADLSQAFRIETVRVQSSPPEDDIDAGDGASSPATAGEGPAPAAAAAGPTITTDLDDYAPGANAFVTIEGIDPGSTVRFEVDHVNDPGADGIWGTFDDVTYQLGGDGHDAWYVTDGGDGDLDGEADGRILTTWHVNRDDSYLERFLLTGHVVQAGLDGVFGTDDDQTTDAAASNTFTDAGGDYSIAFSVGDPGQYNKKRPSEFTVIPTGRADEPIPGAVDSTSKQSLSPKELALGQIVPFIAEITTKSSATFTGTMEFVVAWSTKTSSGRDFGYDDTFGLFAAFVDGLDASTTDNDATVQSFSWIHDPVANEILGTIRVTNLSPNVGAVVELWVVIDPIITSGTNGNVPSRLVSAREIGTNSTITTGNQNVPLLRVAEFLTGAADLAVVVSDEPNDTNVSAANDPDPFVRAGDQFTYTIVVNNKSTDTVANGVILRDTLDANVDFVSATANGQAVTGVYDSATHRVTIDLFFLDKIGLENNSRTVTITVRVKDGIPPGTTLSNTATVSSLTAEGNAADNTNTETTVLATNSPPVAVNDTNTLAEDTTLTVPASGGVLANDSDPDGHPMTVTQFTVGGVTRSAGQTAAVAGGSLTLNADGSYAFVPTANFNGAIPTVTYTVADSFGGTATATLSLTVTPVNDAPVATADSATTTEDNAVLVSVLSNDSDIDGDTLVIAGVTQGSNGAVSIVGGQLRYTPNADFNGTDSFSYTVSDGNGGTSTATVSVTVTTVNDAPVAADDSATVAEDGTVLVDVLANDSDIDGDTLTISGVTQGANGTVAIEAGQLRYTPDANFNGIDTFTYTVSDGNGGTATATVSVDVGGTNDAPVALDDAASVAEDGSVLVDVLANDSDVDGDTLVIAGVTQGSNGAVSIVGGQLRYTPGADFNGSDSFSYTVSDGNGGTSTATVSVTVSPVNDAPVAADDAASVAEDGSVLVDVLANDSDIDGDTLTISGVTQGANGTVAIEAGQLRYTPGANFNGSDSFTYTVSDGQGGTATATVSVTVTPVNDAPVTLDDAASTSEDTTVTIDVLANDSDVDGDTLVIAGVTQGANGSVAIEAGQVRYTPGADFNGTDSFTYTVSDGQGGTATATVSVTVTPVNDAPVALDDAASTSEDTTVTIDVLANDSDVDGDVLTISGVTQGANGTVAVVGGRLVYDPDANFNGIDTFTYTVSDGNGGTATATVSVDVGGTNDAPVALDDSASVAEDGSVLVDVLVNDSDIDGDTLVIAGVTQGSNGAVSIVGGQIRYTPGADFNGTDSFTYTVSDGQGGTDTATVSVTVSPVNDAPVALDDAASVAEDGTVLVDVLANDSDIDGDALTISGVTQGSNGTVAIEAAQLRYTPGANFNGTDSFSYTVSDGNGGTSTATVTVTVSPVNDAPVAADDSATVAEDGSVLVDVLANDSDVDGDTLVIAGVTQGANGTVAIEAGQVRYTPGANFNGSDSFTYTVSDGQGGTATATVSVTVTPVNDAPVALDDAASVAEDGTVLVDVLANDSDVDGDTLTISGVTQGANGTVAIEAGQLRYTPGADFNGSDSFTYTVSDGQGGTDTATVSVTVTPVNDAPVALDDAASTSEDTTVTIDVLANDSDVDGDALTISGVTQGANGTVAVVGGRLVYDPDANFNGIDTFTYTVSDSNGGTATATVSVDVGGTNDAPVALDDAASVAEDGTVLVDVLANDSDVDGDTLVISGVTQGSSGAVSIVGGQLRYTPGANFNGSDSFSYTVSDGNGGTDTATVSVTVSPVNDAPVAADDSATVAEDGSVLVDVLANDSDIDGDTLTISGVTQGANGTVAIEAGQLRYTPGADFNGSDSFTYTVSDGQGGTDTATVSVTVTPVNDAPVALDDAASVAEDGSVLVDVLANDSDIDGDTLVIAGVTQGSNGAVSIVGGQLRYTPGADFNGSDSFSYTVSDGNGGSDTATVSVTVTPVNDAPVALDDAASVAEDGSVLVDVLANDSDIDGDTLSISGVTQGANGTVAIEAGQLRYTPGANFNGTDSFTYTVSDGQGGTDIATVSVTVTPVNDAPVALDDDASVAEDGTVLVDVLANDSDIDGDTLSISGVTQGANGTVAIEAGQLRYTPGADFNGSDSFSYTVSDGQGGTATATVSVTVTPINDAPVALDDSASVAEDGTVLVDVLANDSDVDGDTLVISGVTQGSSGAVSIVGGQIRYTPGADFNGTDSFTYTVSDGQGGTAAATVSVTVTPVNDAPVALDDSASVAEDGSVLVDVLANDSDIDGDTLSISGVTQGANGTVAIEAGQVRYTPGADFNGSDSFTYTVSDGQGGTATATVSVTVTPVNDAPVALDDAASTSEDTTVTIDVLANDSDVDGDPLTISGVTQGANGTVAVVGGRLVYDPDANFNGIDTFTYTVSDGNGGTSTATVSVDVGGTNDAPVALDDAASVAEDGSVLVDVLANDSDVDGDTLVIAGVTQGANGTVAIEAGQVRYTPGADFNGTDSFTYTVSDGNGGTATATVSVTVTPVNDAPVALDDAASVAEDNAVLVSVLANDSDIDGDTLVIAGVTQGSNGAVSIVGGQLRYTPGANFNGSDSFTYTVSDGQGGTATATVSVTVTPVNDAPVALDDAASVAEDGTVLVDVLANDSDIDGDALTISGVTQGSNGTVAIEAGQLRYTPGADFNGTDSFTYTVSDGNGGTATATVSVTVTPVNDAPVALDDVGNSSADGAVDIVVTANDSDIDGDTLEVLSVDTTGIAGTVTILDARTVRYDPNGAFDFLGQGDTATETFSYTVRDPSGATATASVTVTIGGVNDAPVAVNDSARTGQDRTTTFDLLGNDSDPNGDALSIVGTTAPANGSLTLNGDGTVTYDPDRTFFGIDSFQYTVSDGRGGTATATASITVDRNLAPRIPEPVVFFAPENQTRGANLRAIDPEGDPVTYSLVGGVDAGLFTIDPLSGALDFIKAPDFEKPSDSDGDNRYRVMVGLSDGFSTITQSVTVNVTNLDDNNAPTIPSHASGKMSKFLLVSNKGKLLDVNAVDLDGDTLVYRLFGEDASKFTIDQDTGELFLPTPLRDPRGSFDGDSIYELQILVDDGHGGTALLDIEYSLVTAA